jgi:dTDP-4-dehydrorhamnose 3,5-epimerase
MYDDWSIEGKRDAQLVRSDWTPTDILPIEGVRSQLIGNVLRDNGTLTEVWREDWALDPLPVGQVFQRSLHPGARSAWHAHRVTTDRLFCATGRLKIVLYDARVDSPTHGTVAEYRSGEERPAIITVPPGVWHGVQNIGTTVSILLNLVDLAYAYDAPDHYRIDADSPDIPYTW